MSTKTKTGQTPLSGATQGNGKVAPKNKLSQQYGGVHAGGWVNRLPASWTPYIQLSRLSPPAALFLVYFPHFFGIMHAAATKAYSPYGAVRVAVILLGGSLFYSNAAHAWNDLIDAPIDALIERTRKRPIPRGAITPRAALIFAVTQALGAASFLLTLPTDTSIVVVPNILATMYYPYAKRDTYFPQVVLGFCLSWGILVGSSAMGVPQPWTDESTTYLLVASILWVVIFDTIYAHQDLVGDTKIGVKSMAVLLGSYAKIVLWLLFFGMIASLFASGYTGEMGFGYYTITLGGCIWSVGRMVAHVDLKDPASCWMWFSQGFWLTALAISSGLLAEYGLHSGWVGDVSIQRLGLSLQSL